MSEEAKNEWLASSIRITVFPNLAIKPEEMPEWNDITGFDPDESSTQHKLHKTVQKGLFENLYLLLTKMPGRLDIECIPVIKEDSFQEYPVIGLFTEVIEKGRALVQKFLETYNQNSTRLAIGAKLLLPTKSHFTAYQQLNEYIKHVKVDPNTSDFMYQVNHRINSDTGLDELEINRLTKWRAIKIAPVINKQEQATKYASCLELDVNTSDGYKKEIKHNDAQTIFNELINLSVAITKEGI